MATTPTKAGPPNAAAYWPANVLRPWRRWFDWQAAGILSLIADLSQAMEHCETEAEKGEANTYYHANDTFHQLIYRASGNAFLVQETIQLKNRLKPYRRLQLQVRHRLAQSVAEHRNLAQAIRNGEEELAAQAARQHVLVQGQRFTDLISALTQSRQASASPERA